MTLYCVVIRFVFHLIVFAQTYFFIGTNTIQFLYIFYSEIPKHVPSAAITGSTNSFHTHNHLPQEKHSSVFVSTMPGL